MKKCAIVGLIVLFAATAYGVQPTSIVTADAILAEYQLAEAHRPTDDGAAIVAFQNKWLQRGTFICSGVIVDRDLVVPLVDLVGKWPNCVTVYFDGPIPTNALRGTKIVFECRFVVSGGQPRLWCQRVLSVN